MSAASALARLSELCLAFPEVLEDPAGVGNHSFKVVGRNFVVHVGNHHSDGRTAVWCQARREVQGLVEDRYRLAAPRRLTRSLG